MISFHMNKKKNQERPGGNGGPYTTFSYRVMVLNLFGFHFRV